MAERSNKKTLREEIKRHIVKCINDGRYKCGDRIVETRLARELEVSQAPVREAVIELSILGVLEERPYAGSFVRTLDEDEIDNHYKVRNLLESFAAAQAAQHRTEAELEGMRSVIGHMKECTDPEKFVELDHSFHRMIMEATGNDVLKRLWLTTSAYESTYRALLTNKWTIGDLYEAHKRIFDRIASQNSDAASAEMYLHIDGFRAGASGKYE